MKLLNKIISTTCIIIGFWGAVTGQIVGEIEYDRTIYYSRIIDGLPYLTKEEKDRQKLSWGKDEGSSYPYILQFTDSLSLYTYGEKEKEYSYSWKKDEFLLLRDAVNKRMMNQQVLGGKLYVVEDDTPLTKWKILNEIREVEGYLCMKAETRDPLKEQIIHAWFTTEIPISGGPEGFGGLPGMILMLEINEGTAIIEAKKVVLDTPPKFDIPKKIKGKRVSQQEYLAVLEKYFNQCLDGKRNPFWQTRY